MRQDRAAQGESRFLVPLPPDILPELFGIAAHSAFQLQIRGQQSDSSCRTISSFQEPEPVECLAPSQNMSADSQARQRSGSGAEWLPYSLPCRGHDRRARSRLKEGRQYQPSPAVANAPYAGAFPLREEFLHLFRHSSVPQSQFLVPGLRRFAGSQDCMLWMNSFTPPRNRSDRVGWF